MVIRKSVLKSKKYENIFTPNSLGTFKTLSPAVQIA